MKKPILNNCSFAKSARLHTEGRVSIRDTELHNSIYIGFSSYMGAGVIRGNISIGRYCSIGRDVKLGLSEHRLDSFTTHPLFNDLIAVDTEAHAAQNYLSHTLVDHPQAKIHLIIKDDVWIGDNVLVKKGLTIGQGAVIGANSLVTKDVPPYAIVAGTPAKVLRYRFTDDIIEKLINSNWVNADPVDIRNIGVCNNISDFINAVANLDKNFAQNYERYTPG